jgi:hypothetical protein
MARSWMLLDALFHCREGFVGPPLKNVMYVQALDLELIEISI